VKPKQASRPSSRPVRRAAVGVHCMACIPEQIFAATSKPQGVAQSVNRSAAPASSRRPLPKAEAVGQQLADRRATHATGARAADRSSRAGSRAEQSRPDRPRRAWRGLRSSAPARPRALLSNLGKIKTSSWERSS
jgi:hypothetical protein